MAVFLTLAYRYEDLGRPKSYVPWLEGWADWAMYDLARTPYGGMQHTTYAGPNHHELWDDTLMMTVMPLAKIGLVLNRPAYVEEAKRQFLLHIRYLWDPTTGLFFHGWKFDENAPGGVGHNFARARWARGNSWVTIVIPEFIELLDLPPNDPIRRDLIDVLLAQCKALKRLQNPDGLWRTLLDEPENEGSYVEASASAGFAYGMLKAMRKRYIAKEEFEDCAIKGIKAVIEKISPEGELLNTSFGTGMGNSLQHYKDIAITSMPYGQSMAIMALVEFLQVWMWRMDEPFWKDPSLALAEKR